MSAFRDEYASCIISAAEKDHAWLPPKSSVYVGRPTDILALHFDRAAAFGMRAFLGTVRVLASRPCLFGQRNVHGSSVQQSGGLRRALSSRAQAVSSQQAQYAWAVIVACVAALYVLHARFK